MKASTVFPPSTTNLPRPKTSTFRVWHNKYKMGSEKIPDTPTCRKISSQKVFPAAPVTGGEKAVRLSIADATVARFSPCAAVWLYDATEASRDTNLLRARLQQALGQTLDDYPHFAGQLRWATSNNNNSEPLRLGRPVVTYGTREDPGVEFTAAAYDGGLAALVPSEEARRGGGQRVWIASDFPQDELLPGAELAFESHLGRFEGLPGASAQVTTFSCGGFAVGIKITHCLSDAVCLVQFAKAWSARAGALFSSETLAAGSSSSPPPRAAVFDPSLLDRHAGLQQGRRDAVADDDKIRLARSLPMHRYDWWRADAPGYPAWAAASSAATRPTAAQLRDITLSPSTAPPWTTWDAAAPVAHAQIRFGGDEVRRIKAAAQADLVVKEEEEDCLGISRLDALLSHVWILINRARKIDLDDDDEPVYMDLTLGLRTRVDPPLPATFAGSPLLLAHVLLLSSSSSLGAVALAVRQAVARFTPDAVAAYLHDAAHEVSPQRLWQAFLGRRHTLVTSWARAGCYEVGDFVGGTKGTKGRPPRYVQGRMPRVDGCCQVMDGVGEDGRDFEVSLCLEEGALGRLVRDERLGAYSSSSQA